MKDKLTRLGKVLLIISSVIPIYYYGKLIYYIFNIPEIIFIHTFSTGIVGIFITIIIFIILYQIIRFIYQIGRYINTGHFY